MSLVTRCPACETLFKVVPDQLRVSGGWVRCGQCDTVFDASLHLLQTAPGSLTQPSDDAPTPELEPPLAAVVWVEPEPEPEVVAKPESVTEPKPEAEAEQALTSVAEIHVPSLQAQRGNPGVVVHSDLRVTASPPSALTAESETFELPTASFLHRASRHASPRTPRRTALLVLLSLLLLFGFLGQIVVQERDRLAAWQPGLQPLLLALCVPLNCQLSPLRRIEAIVIDSSSFSKVQGDFYRLSLTLKNTDDTPLALPAIEITLTDARDEPVVRRIFLPTELGAPADTLAAGEAWSPSLTLAFSAGESAEAMVGYRLLAFYP